MALLSLWRLGGGQLQNGGAKTLKKGAGDGEGCIVALRTGGGDEAG